MKTLGLSPTGYGFERFRIDVERRVLFRDEQPVALPSKAFDVLLCLVEHRGTVMEKEDILKSVWPDTFVEEANLTVHVSTLRKVLGEQPGAHRFILTVPKRGYGFVAEVLPVFPHETETGSPKVAATPKAFKKPGGLALAALSLGLIAVLAAGGFGWVRLGTAGKSRPTPSRQAGDEEDPEIRVACERGWYLFHKGTAQGPRRGLFFFQQALEQNPNSVEAMAGLANSYCRMAIDAGDESERRSFLEQAKVTTAKACRLDPPNAEAHSAQAFLAMLADRNPFQAQREHEYALSLNPNSALAHIRYGWFLYGRKDFVRAEREAWTAARLDPVSPTCQTSLARMLLELGKFQEADLQCRHVLEFEPEHQPAILIRSRILVEQHRYDEAVALLTPLVDLDRPEGNIVEAVSTLGTAQAGLGRTRDARRALDFLETYPTIYSGFHRLLILEALGDRDAARKELARIARTGGPSLSLAKTDPRLAALTRNAGF